MKGKISLYFNAPNFTRVRTRLNEPSKELSTKMRGEIQAVAAEILNEGILAMRSKLIARFQNLGETVKDEKKAAELASVLNSFFDVVFSTETFSTPGEKNDDETTEEAEGASEEAPEEAEEAPEEEID